jgi:hypothetical protein
MKLVLIGRFIAVVLAVVRSAVNFSVADLLVEYSRSNGLVRYPAAERLTATRVAVDSLARGYVTQARVYRSADDTVNVFSWYAHAYGLDPNQTPGAIDSRHLIFVNRSLALL